MMKDSTLLIFVKDNEYTNKNFKNGGVQKATIQKVKIKEKTSMNVLIKKCLKT